MIDSKQDSLASTVCSVKLLMLLMQCDAAYVGIELSELIFMLKKILQC
jgi:hypothetical protein